MKILKNASRVSVVLAGVSMKILNEKSSARDRTTYGRARNSTRLFYLHHTRLIAKAAVVNDAMGIREQVQGLRQRVCAAHAAASGWP